MSDDCTASALGGSVLLPNPISIGASNKQLCQKNPCRKEIIIVNASPSVVYLKLGAPITSSSEYTIPLAGCAVGGDGTGGIYISDIWQGEIHAFCTNANGVLMVTELI